MGMQDKHDYYQFHLKREEGEANETEKEEDDDDDDDEIPFQRYVSSHHVH